MGSLRCFYHSSLTCFFAKFLTLDERTKVSQVTCSFFNAIFLTCTLWWIIIWAGDRPYLSNPVRWAFIPFDSWELRTCLYPITYFSWHISPSLFLCSALKYINWQRLWSKCGYCVMNVFWQQCLIHIPDICFWNMS